jgi:DNA-binding NarL/FixJ family response regulator
MDILISQRDEKYRILLVDDHPIILVGLAQVINAQTDLITCGSLSVEGATQDVIKSHRPDLVLLDLRLQGGDGLEAIRALSNEVSNARVLVHSQLAESLYAERALRAGANGYIMKGQPIPELLGAIRSVLAGEVFLSRAVTNQLLQKNIIGRGQQRSPRTECLTDREIQVLMMIGIGMGSRKIAQDLHLSIKTIETYREHLKSKLNLSGAPELVHFATNFIDHHSSPPGDLAESLGAVNGATANANFF